MIKQLLFKYGGIVVGMGLFFAVVGVLANLGQETAARQTGETAAQDLIKNCKTPKPETGVVYWSVAYDLSVEGLTRLAEIAVSKGWCPNDHISTFKTAYVAYCRRVRDKDFPGNVYAVREEEKAKRQQQASPSQQQGKKYMTAQELHDATDRANAVLGDVAIKLRGNAEFREIFRSLYGRYPTSGDDVLKYTLDPDFIAACLAAYGHGPSDMEQ